MVEVLIKSVRSERGESFGVNGLSTRVLRVVSFSYSSSLYHVSLSFPLEVV